MTEKERTQTVSPKQRSMSPIKMEEKEMSQTLAINMDFASWRPRRQRAGLLLSRFWRRVRDH